MPEFDPQRFALAAWKLYKQHGPTEKFTRAFRDLIFRYLGPRGSNLTADQVAFRLISHGDVGTLTAEMFVLGGGLLKVVVQGTSTTLVDLDPDIDDLEKAPSWVTGGDHHVVGAQFNPGGQWRKQ